MQKTTINLHTEFKIAPVDPRIFGGFLEHMGRAVYEGIYDPKSPHADADGCRKDVLEQLRLLKMTAMRYPGGNFVSGYHWQDGVGARSKRPTLRDTAWKSIEPNHFGTDEYIHLCRKMGWTPMLTVNLGTGTPEEACDWLEYCNCPTGTRYADMRAANGRKQPHAVKLWGLGNEMDNQFQLGHVPADQYAIRAFQTATMMKETDNSIELVACGSCCTHLPTYMEWDRQVLDYMNKLDKTWPGIIDYISLHRYTGNYTNNTLDYLATTNGIDGQIEEMDAVCRFIQAKHRSKKRAYLCFDEWNVQYRNFLPRNKKMEEQGKFAPHLCEEVYNLEDALVVAGFLHSFIRHADVVKIANLSMIVNVIAPILTRDNAMLVQSIFHPFAMFSKRRNGTSLRCSVNGPSYEGISNGLVHFIDSSTILDGNNLHVFLTNRSLDETADTCIALADRSIVSCENAEVLTGPGPKAVNTFENGNVVTAQPFGDITVAADQAHCKLPPLSFAAITLNLT